MMKEYLLGSQGSAGLGSSDALDVSSSGLASSRVLSEGDIVFESWERMNERQEGQSREKRIRDVHTLDEKMRG